MADIEANALVDRRTLIKGAGAALVASALDFPAAHAESADPLCYASVDELKAMFQAGKASPVDLLKAQIKRIEALNSKVNCITYEHFDQALKEAKQSEDRYRRGDARPLEGITVAIKDEFTRPGWRVTQGSLIFKDLPLATENSAIIDSLETAGAIMPIQTTVPEFYLFLGASTRAWGTTHNPWNLSTPRADRPRDRARRWPRASRRSPWDRTWAVRSEFPPRKTVSTASGRRSGGSRAGKSPSRPRARWRDASTILSICRTRLSAPPTRSWPRSGLASTILPNTRTFRDGASPWIGAQPLPALFRRLKDAMLKGIEALRAAGCVVDEVDCGFSKEQKFVFMRGLFATSIGTLLEISNSHRDQLSPYMAEVLDLAGPVGPRQAEEVEALLEQLHRQVQQRVFGKGYRICSCRPWRRPLSGPTCSRARRTRWTCGRAQGSGSR